MAYDLTARLRLIDNMTAPLRRVTESLKRTDSVVNKAASATNAYERVTDKASRSVSQLTNDNNRVTRSFGSLPGIIGKATAALGALAIGTAAVSFAVSSLNKAMDFEEQMSTIQALTGATNDEMKRMNDLAIQMGANTKYSALEAAQGIEELLKAGLSPAAVEAGGLEAALNLATAGGLGLADAAEIMSTALNAYKKDAMTAAQASDILAGTANASATGVMDLRFSLAMVSAVAAGVGQSFKDTNTALGLFANNGLKGSDAGTSLKVMLMNLSPKTKKATELMQKLGIITKKGQNQFYTAKGELRNLSEVTDVLRKSLEKLNPKDRMDALTEMFGTDGVRGATILFNEGAEGVRNFQEEMLKVTALDVAKKKMDNAKGAMEQLGGAIETVQIAALQPLLPVIKDITLMLADMAEQYGPQVAAVFEDIGRSVREFLDPYLNDPNTWKVTGQAELKFKQAEMLDRTGGPPPFWENLLGRFNEWYESSGRQMIEDGVSRITKDLGQFFESNAGPITEAAVSIGVKMGASILEGIRSGLSGSALGSSVVNTIVPGYNLASEGRNWVADKFFNDSGEEKPFYHGIDYVPRDGVNARLHKGERVLTARENSQYENGGGRAVSVSGNTFVVNAAGGDITDDKVMDQILEGFVRKLSEAAESDGM